MVKLSPNKYGALKATLMRVAAQHPDGVLFCGNDKMTEQEFCKLIKVERNLARLLQCTRIDIKGLGYYPDIERKFVTWLQSHVRAPSMEPFCNSILSPANWLKYNIAPDLHCLHLGIGEVDYYMIMTNSNVMYFRSIAFKYKYKTDKAS